MYLIQYIITYLPTNLKKKQFDNIKEKQDKLDDIGRLYRHNNNELFLCISTWF